MIKNITTMIILLVAALGLTGCWENSEVIMHEPGQYMGASDDLQTDTGALEKRLDGQRDR